MGKHYIECPRCDGKGFKVEDRYDENGKYNGYDEYECSYCHGTGKVDYDEDYWNRHSGRGKIFSSW